VAAFVAEQAQFRHFDPALQKMAADHTGVFASERVIRSHDHHLLLAPQCAAWGTLSNAFATGMPNFEYLA
jgi:hypothetical protein